MTCVQTKDGETQQMTHNINPLRYNVCKLSGLVAMFSLANYDVVRSCSLAVSTSLTRCQYTLSTCYMHWFWPLIIFYRIEMKRAPMFSMQEPVGIVAKQIVIDFCTMKHN